MPNTTESKPQVFIHEAVSFINEATKATIQNHGIAPSAVRYFPDSENVRLQTIFPGYNYEFGDIFGSKVVLYIQSDGYLEQKWRIEVATSGCCRSIEHSMYLAKLLVAINELAAKAEEYLNAHDVIPTPEAIERQRLENEAAAARWRAVQDAKEAEKAKKKANQYLKASVTRRFNKVIASGVLQEQDVMRIQSMIDAGKYGEVKALLS